jgi:hypothetical protein
MKYNCVILVLFLFLLSCQNRSQDVVVIETVIPGQLSPTDRDSAKYLVFHYGDVKSYKRLRNYYTCFLPEEYELEILGYSWIMADTYNYPQAYFDLYFELHLFEENLQKKVSPATREFMIECLKKAAELGYPQAQEELLKLNKDK